MALIDVKAPSVGESITEVVIGEWLKQPGEWVDEDESIVVVESDKVNMEVPAPKAGVLTAALSEEGDTVAVGALIAQLDPEAKPAAAPQVTETPAAAETPQASTSQSAQGARVMPSAARVLAERGLSADQVTASGPGGRLLKEDVLNHKSSTQAPSSAKPAVPAPAAPKPVAGQREVESVKMSPLRRTIAKRLLEAQQNAAILSTFNEVDMSGIMEIRKRYKDAFINKHGIKLGFMSFFVKAVLKHLSNSLQSTHRLKVTMSSITTTVISVSQSVAVKVLSFRSSEMLKP